MKRATFDLGLNSYKQSRDSVLVRFTRHIKTASSGHFPLQSFWPAKAYEAGGGGGGGGTGGSSPPPKKI